MSLELRFDSAMIEEVVSKPYFSEMSLVLVGGVDLLDSVELFCGEVEPFPDLTEPSSPQLFSFQVTVDEGFVLEFMFPEVRLFRDQALTCVGSCRVISVRRFILFYFVLVGLVSQFGFNGRVLPFTDKTSVYTGLKLVV